MGCYYRFLNRGVINETYLYRNRPMFACPVRTSCPPTGQVHEKNYRPFSRTTNQLPVKFCKTTGQLSKTTGQKCRCPPYLSDIAFCKALIDLSLPTNSGITILGKTTMSLNGNKGCVNLTSITSNMDIIFYIAIGNFCLLTLIKPQKSFLFLICSSCEQ